MRAVWSVACVRPRFFKMTRPAREYVAHVVALPPPRPVPEHEYLMT